MKSVLTKDNWENKWIALKQKPDEVIASARTYKALARKLKKAQKEQVVLLKIPKSDQFMP